MSNAWTNLAAANNFIVILYVTTHLYCMEFHALFRILILNNFPLETKELTERVVYLILVTRTLSAGCLGVIIL